MIRRFLSFCIDWVVIFAVGFALSLLGPQFDPEYLLYPSIQMFSAYGVILSFLWFIAVPLCKDILGGASLGKRICGLRVVSKDGGKANAGKRILRNITFYFVVVEIIVALVNKGTRLGDMLARTQVVQK